MEQKAIQARTRAAALCGVPKKAKPPLLNVR